MFSKEFKKVLENNGYFGLSIEVNTHSNLLKEYEEDYITSINFKIKSVEKESEDEVIIASISFQQIQVLLDNLYDTSESELFYTMDAISQELCELAEGLGIVSGNINEELESCLIEDFLIYLSRFEIIPKLRNLGLGSEILKLLPKMLENTLNYTPTNITLIASPFEYNEDEKKYKIMLRKLKRFYKKVGFVEGSCIYVMYLLINTL